MPRHIPGQIPSQITDPYTIYSTPLQPATEPAAQQQTPPLAESNSNAGSERRENPPPAPAPSERRTPASHHSSSRRPQGYHPDDASGVRQIYRGPDYDVTPAEYTSTGSPEHAAPVERRAASVSIFPEMKPAAEPLNLSPRPSSSTTESQASHMGQHHTDPQPHAARPESAASSTTATGGQWPPASEDRSPSVDPS